MLTQVAPNPCIPKALFLATLSRQPGRSWVADRYRNIKGMQAFFNEIHMNSLIIQNQKTVLLLTAS